MIELQSIWFRYPRQRSWALRNVSLVLNRNEYVAVVGPNGSGKTTLLKIASLIYRPVEGKVLVDNRDFWSIDSDERLSIRRRVTYVHEKPVLLRGSVLHNIAYGLLIRGISREKALEKAKSMLKIFNLEYLIDRNSRELSAGEAQLVAIARALVLDPDIVFLDEPFAHLDREKRNILIEVLKNYREKGTGFVIATHNEYMLSSIIDRVLVLEEGVLVEDRKV